MKLNTHPVWAMAFRPFYLLSALYGALSILLWTFGYQGTTALPAYFWHAHEMIWGYAGAVVVAFLLTAVATWTGQPPTRGVPLMVLTAFWLLARIGAFLPNTLITAVFGTAFFWLATWFMGQSVVCSRNSRNYIAVVALFLFGATHAVFHLFLQPFNPTPLQNGLFAGLVMVAGFIGLVGTRIIPFFTARRLGCTQAVTTPLFAVLPLLLPMIMAVFLLIPVSIPVIPALCGIAAGVLGCVQTIRWLNKGVWREPMLWILFAGYAACALGLAVMGISFMLPEWASLGVHLIAVGGIGLLTLGMMTRTALGHTGRSIYPAPRPMTLAFYLMILATLCRAVAALCIARFPAAYTHGIYCAGVLFAAALLLYAWRYAPWLLSPRLDGKAG